MNEELKTRYPEADFEPQRGSKYRYDEVARYLDVYPEMAGDFAALDALAASAPSRMQQQKMVWSMAEWQLGHMARLLKERGVEVAPLPLSRLNAAIDKRTGDRSADVLGEQLREKDAAYVQLERDMDEQDSVYLRQLAERDDTIRRQDEERERTNLEHDREMEALQQAHGREMAAAARLLKRRQFEGVSEQEAEEQENPVELTEEQKLARKVKTAKAISKRNEREASAEAMEEEKKLQAAVKDLTTPQKNNKGDYYPEPLMKSKDKAREMLLGLKPYSKIRIVWYQGLRPYAEKGHINFLMMDGTMAFSRAIYAFTGIDNDGPKLDSFNSSLWNFINDYIKKKKLLEGMK